MHAHTRPEWGGVGFTAFQLNHASLTLGVDGGVWGLWDGHLGFRLT